MSELRLANWMLILNPAAANGRAGKIWVQLEKKVRSVIPNITVLQTEYTGHAIQLAKEAIQSGYRHLMAAGGDGTNHEVVNGILQQSVVPSQEITYALLPLGTGNDWIRTHQIPTKIEKWLNMIRIGHCIHQDVGLTRYRDQNNEQKSRYFVNVAGMAYDAFVVRYSEKHRAWLRNQFFYLLLILRCLFKYRLTKGILIADEVSFIQYFYTINIGICRYSGGGMQLVPHAVPNDGQLALTFAGPVSKLGVILNIRKFYNARIGKHPKIHTQQAGKVLVKALDDEPPILLEVDGEFLGKGPAEFSIIKKALCIVAPEKS